MTTIWTPATIGNIRLDHRLAMAPMTRSRANPDGTPGPFAADYYSQRASLGLLITEGTQPSADGQGYLSSPGIYTEAHVAGWRRVTDAVHAAGGHIFIQLMHAGRMGHPDNTPHHRQSVAPSAIAPGDRIYTRDGMREVPAPRALTTEEVAKTVDDFRHAAEQAIAAGADGVEIHGANGYLLQQFLSANANVRDDRYGGSIANRIRLTIEVARAIAAAIGPERTGIRLSPGSRLGGIDEGAEGPDIYRLLVAELAKLDLAYLHISQGQDDGLLPEIRKLWPNALLVNRGNRSLASLAADIDAGLADMAPVGRWAAANPDLVIRLRSNIPLTEPDPRTFFGGGAEGYTDYPTADAQPVA